MTGYDAMLGFSESAVLLESIFPTEKKSWPMFLAQNIHGQTSGSPVIRCDPCFDDIYFNSDHLENFALSHAKGIISEAEIEARVDAFFEKSKMAVALSTEKRISPAFERLGDIFKKHSSSDQIEIRLSEREACDIANEIQYLEGAQKEAANALLTLSMAFRVFKAEGPPSEKEVSALVAIIEEYAERASANACDAEGLSESLFEQLADAEEAIKREPRLYGER
jgi:hypothetical protein